jgi:hypothetical protein
MGSNDSRVKASKVPEPNAPWNKPSPPLIARVPVLRPSPAAKVQPAVWNSPLMELVPPSDMLQLPR